MNTPKDWLLRRHAGAEPQLDARRMAALPASRLSLREFLVELLRPNRRTCSVLAAAWTAIAVLYVVSTPPKPASPGPTREEIAAWLVQHTAANYASFSPARPSS
jgi:hypothetical protein